MSQDLPADLTDLIRALDEHNEELAGRTEALHSLEQTVHENTDIVLDLRKTLDDKIGKREAERMMQENARVRRRVIFTILTSVLVALFATTVANDAVLKHCFLDSRGGMIHEDRLCNTLFPGYDRLVKENNDRLSKFNDLLKQIPANKAETRRLQRDVERLKAGR